MLEIPSEAAGILTLLCDRRQRHCQFRWFLGAQGSPLVSNDHAELSSCFFVYACFGILGHIFSPWLHFHGGKELLLDLAVCTVNHAAPCGAFLCGVVLPLPTKYVSPSSHRCGRCHSTILPAIWWHGSVATIPVFVGQQRRLFRLPSGISARLNAGSESKFSFGEKEKGQQSKLLLLVRDHGVPRFQHFCFSF